MKLKPHTYKAWWDLHAWAGVISSLVVYVFFFFGSWTLFHAELAVWQEQRGPAPSLPEVDQLIDAGIAAGTISPVSLRLNFPRPRSPGFSLSYRNAEGRQERYLERRGLVEARSNVADFFYGMHYLQFPSAPRWLYTLAGLASGVLLSVISTGLLIHLRDIVRQFHQFRPHKKLVVVWSDSHKVLGTLGLPFALVFAFTGGWMGLDAALTSGLSESGFRGDEKALARAMYGEPPDDIEPSKLPGNRLPLAELLARAEAARPARAPDSRGPTDCRAVYLKNVGDREATALFYCGNDDVTLRQADGSQIIPARARGITLSNRISDIPYAMHFVEFAQTPLRALYVLLGVAGCLAILTGNWLWVERRAPSRATWLVQRLTLAVGAGSLLASTLMLVASRLAISPSFERHVFWWSWLAASLVSGLGRDAAALWRWLIALGGASLGLAALLGMFELVPGTLESRPTVARVIDVVFLGAGFALLALARKLRRKTSTVSDDTEVPAGEAANVS